MMTKEEKDILLKDLCARLPYGVKMTDGVDTYRLTSPFLYKYIEMGLKPYLRPMSSMTKEEDKEWQLYKNNIACSCDENLNERINELHDWFNKKEFDYRGLIEIGLALVAPKDMYKN